ncbi:MAG: tetratricopeptide repeat protein [Chloroflexota bacterium]
MSKHPKLPTSLPSGKAIILEAENGQNRRTLLQNWLQEYSTNHTSIHLLACAMEEDGPWSGLKTFLRAILPQITTEMPYVIEQHAYELAMLFPEMRATIEVQNPTLTDLSSDTERTRNWPADRAYRIVHGLIDLTDVWAKHNGGKKLLIACDDFQRAGTLVRLFFVELLRRRGDQHHITLIVATDSSHSEKVQQQFEASRIAQTITITLPVDAPQSICPIQMRQSAEELIQQVGNDAIKREEHLAKIIRYWMSSDTPQKALPYQMVALGTYNTQGLYEDAVSYGETARSQISDSHPDNNEKLMYILLKLCTSYLGLRQADKAFDIITQGLQTATEARHLVPFCYQMAMLQARYLPERNLTKAEAYLERALDIIREADLPAHEKFFQTAFHRNGIALIRYFQKSYDEAIAICRTCIEQLDRYLAPDEHQLHRSVLIYNIAQVYNSMERYDEAIHYYSATMEMDPNYSEYYNERGNIYLQMAQYELAIADYTKAIALSPPYAEVWTNLGQCYRLMGKMEDAVSAYSRALDLEPKQRLALLGRAEAHDALQQDEDARHDYDTLLTIDPTHVQALLRKAVDAYEEGDFPLTLETLNTALTHHTDITELYWNRAIVLKEMGRFAEAISDVEAYLNGPIDDADRVEAEAELAALRERTLPSMELQAQ